MRDSDLDSIHNPYISIFREKFSSETLWYICMNNVLISQKNNYIGSEKYISIPFTCSTSLKQRNELNFDGYHP